MFVLILEQDMALEFTDEPVTTPPTFLAEKTAWKRTFVFCSQEQIMNLDRFLFLLV